MPIPTNITGSHIPLLVNSKLADLTITDELLYWYPWIPNLKNKNTWLALGQNWKPNGDFPDSPPPGADYYIVYGDSMMFGLAEQIAKANQAPVFQLSAPLVESNFSTELVTYLPYTTDHQRINGVPRECSITKDIKYKASALTDRVTQSKAIIFSALTSMLNEQEFVGSLRNGNNLLKNVHYWEMSGNKLCDHYMQNFIDHWKNKQMSMTDDNSKAESYNNPAYINSALNFTQESYHYSYMMSSGKSYIEPGPFLTEKTYKCLLSKTAFIPVGQYKSYQWLESLGMKFNYGELDLSFDQDPGNLTRLEKIINLIKSLSLWTAVELYDMTLDSCAHNYDHIMNGNFWKRCEDHNQSTINTLTQLN
jgi:hypothetical protein